MSSKERQTKPPVGDTRRSIQDLFRMDNRTIVSTSTIHCEKTRRNRRLKYARTVTGGGGAVGLEAARSILESGGDVVCLDRQDKPLPGPWGKYIVTICMDLWFV